MKITNSMKLKLLEKFLESNSAFECLMDDSGKVDYTIIGTLVDAEVPMSRYKSAYENARDHEGYVDKIDLADKVATQCWKELDCLDEAVEKHWKESVSNVCL